MKTVGVICEYNPLHLGHAKQLGTIRQLQGSDCGIVCLMSGNFVQRGAPAVFSKSLRAKAAILCGADLVLEMPVTGALSSAEGFASTGVSILSAFCDALCFGAENPDAERLHSTARALLSPQFSDALRQQLDKGLSFPAARQAALDTMGADSGCLLQPNDILAVEYCKAVLAQESSMELLPILRRGGYHDTAPDKENPSATALRELITGSEPWLSYVPKAAQDVFDGAKAHTLAAGERAVLARLRYMTEPEFEALPHSSEGLWRKLMHAVRREATLEDILAAAKSKRYTRTRLDRMVMCAFLGITRQIMHTPAPYVRVLAFSDTGRQILKRARLIGDFPNIGERRDHSWQQLEDRCTDLYGLFADGTPDAAGDEARQRIFCRED